MAKTVKTVVAHDPAEFVKVEEFTRRILDIENDRDYSARQNAVLAFFATHPGMSVREAAEQLKLSKPAVTRAADRLNEQSMIARGASAADRRLVAITATAAGLAYLRAYTSILNGESNAAPEKTATKRKKAA